jgi:hypothetical protein
MLKGNHMKAAENQFLPFLEGKKQFVIPIYQRTYCSGDTCKPMNHSNEKPTNTP